MWVIHTLDATYTQKSNALSSYNASKFKYVNNSNYYLTGNFTTKKHYSSAPGYKASTFQTKPDSVNYKRGNKKVNFKSNYFLPVISVISVPVSRLGKLRKSDVQATQFSAKREFEGMQFTSDGSSYLLANKGAEILKGTTKSF
ncbi:hypothetical protein NR458_09240 [Pediococcus ethanolidurans]|uniref:hypothetical protein n=1 Tax=Pediococcus ethanolidurans TaxID=319653 RepID=UPI001C1E9C85|nr:hypothetical protein [Pediococcus ethanolidurans]MBU7555233.1 hypothetical protein [Pediococcus ethanolidurans]MCV3324463.1 hypothetical protein [Pediococcus ethanolidurans]